MNSENKTFFTDVRVEKQGGEFQVSLQVTENVTSQVFLDLLSMGVSMHAYNTTTDFDTVTITYVDAANKQLGIVTVPKKAAADIVEYAKAHSSAAENPYFKTFNSVVTRMYDPAVPEFFPTAMMEEPAPEWGSTSDDQTDYTALLAQPATHLDISCSGSDNWDADADDDGITYYIEPRSADGNLIPIEGTITTRVYESMPSWRSVTNRKNDRRKSLPAAMCRPTHLQSRIDIPHGQMHAGGMFRRQISDFEAVLGGICSSSPTGADSLPREA